MGISQLVMIVWFIIILLYAANQHGKNRRGRVNFWVILVMIVINFSVLAFGGFFDGISITI